MQKTSFAPMLIIPSGTTNIDFYIKALGATEVRRFANDDGSIHVSELDIDGVLFHLHEENAEKGRLDPYTVKGITTDIGLFTENVDAIMVNAAKAGATITSPPEDYDYGYRQGSFIDPFGHHWTVQK